MSDTLRGKARDVVARIGAAQFTADDARLLHAEEVAGSNRKTVKDALEEVIDQAHVADASPGLASAPAPEPPARARAPRAVPWERRKWHDHDLYICRVCHRDFFDAGEIWEHVRKKHPGAFDPDNL